MIGSARTAWCCVLAAVLATVLSAVFWNGLLITGGYFWVTNTENVSGDRSRDADMVSWHGMGWYGMGWDTHQHRERVILTVDG